MILALAILTSQLAAPTKSVQSFLDSLTTTQRSEATFPFESDVRLAWAFVPQDRKGVALQNLDAAQRAKLAVLLKELLGDEGYRKAEGVRTLEGVLRELEGDGRRPEYYLTTVFGEPGASHWGLRYEGHHLSLNYTFAGGKVVSSSPQFVGANPAEVASGPHKGMRLLGKEEDMARELLMSLSQELRAKAILSEKAPAEIVTSNIRKASILEGSGASYKEMKPAQQKLLRALVEEHARIQNKEVIAIRLKETDWDNLVFAWLGSPEKGKGHYYRIQTKQFLIEYDDTQNNANHIHTVWRDFEGDFGSDALAEHYNTAEASHGHDHPHPHPHPH